MARSNHHGTSDASRSRFHSPDVPPGDAPSGPVATGVEAVEASVARWSLPAPSPIVREVRGVVLHGPESRLPVFRHAFSTLVVCQQAIGAARLAVVARRLLDRGCVMLHAVGLSDETEAITHAFDALVDDNPGLYGGCDLPTRYSSFDIPATPFGDREDDRAELLNTLRCFIHPFDPIPSCLLAVIGDGRDFPLLMGHFTQTIGDASKPLWRARRGVGFGPGRVALADAPLPECHVDVRHN